MASQLRANRRSRSDLFNEERRPFNKEEFPRREEIASVLETILTRITNPANQPSSPIHLPSVEFIDPADPLKDVYDNFKAVTLSPDDLKTDVGLRARAIENLCGALNIGYHRALGLPPAVLFRQNQATTFYTAEYPDQPSGQLCHIGYANEAIYITKSQPLNKIVHNTRGQTGFGYIPAQHKEDCACPLLTVNNNFSSLTSARMCLPVPFVRIYHENEDLPTHRNMHSHVPSIETLRQYISQKLANVAQFSHFR